VPIGDVKVGRHAAGCIPIAIEEAVRSAVRRQILPELEKQLVRFAPRFFESINSHMITFS
jgi:hypothetical protein